MPIRARVCAEDDRTHPSRHGRAAGDTQGRHAARLPNVQEGCGSFWARAPTHSPCFPGAQVSVKAVQKTGRSGMGTWRNAMVRSEEHTSELQSRGHLVCRLLLEKKKKQ